MEVDDEMGDLGILMIGGRRREEKGREVEDWGRGEV